MTKRKTKTTIAEASAPADMGTAAGAETAARRLKKSREKAAPAITPAAEAAPETTTETSAAALAKKRTKGAKLSALDAAAKVLAEAGQAMTCQEMIDAMAQKGYWTSPGGRTPAATLYSAILRELKTQGAERRFQKIKRGKFARA